MSEQKQDRKEYDSTEITDLSETTEQLEQEENDENDENIDTYERLRRKREKFKRHFALDIMCKHRVITSLLVILLLVALNIAFGIKYIKMLILSVPLSIVTLSCLIEFFRNPEHAIKYGHGYVGFSLLSLLLGEFIILICLILEIVC